MHSPRVRRRPPRWWRVYRAGVWWPQWVGRCARVWQAAVLGAVWPLVLWASGSALFWLADHTLRLSMIATLFGWLGVCCCAAAAVLPFAGGTLLIAAAFRTTPDPPARSATRHADCNGAKHAHQSGRAEVHPILVSRT